MLGVALLETRSDTVFLSLGGVRILTPLPSQVSSSADISVFVSQR